MFNFKKEFPLLVVLAISFGLLIYGWFNFPAVVPTHWDINGKVDGYGPKEFHILLMSILLIVIYGLMLILPKFDPKKEQYTLFEKSYRTLRFAILTMVAVLNAVITLAALGYEVSVSKAILFTVSVLFIVMGNLMGKIRSNYFVGIRTPWTLNDENVWNKTHRFGGKLFVGAGLVSLIGLFVPDIYAFGIFITCVLVATAGSFLYSYREYSKSK